MMKYDEHQHFYYLRIPKIQFILFFFHHFLTILTNSPLFNYFPIFSHFELNFSNFLQYFFSSHLLSPYSTNIAVLNKYKQSTARSSFLDHASGNVKMHQRTNVSASTHHPTSERSSVKPVQRKVATVLPNTDQLHYC